MPDPRSSTTASGGLSAISREANKRRTFAIISHPDAGKTTLTEKFLLYAKAINEAGSVRARQNQRQAKSDWMDLEQQRGISVSSSVLQFPYKNALFNLLDTPGHRDFSEDTYRVLSAVDAVVMVLDAAKGIEDQTLRLFEVARTRKLPILTFVNKFDRPGKASLELVDDIEQQIGLTATPATWPVGIPGDFHGVIDKIGDSSFVKYARTAGGTTAAGEERLSATEAEELLGEAWTTASDELALFPDYDNEELLHGFLEGELTPFFVGSAITNFGVAPLLDAVADFAPSPAPRPQVDGTAAPVDGPFAGQVFKVQTNMDPAHRDRVAFVRVCSGEFRRGMAVTHGESGRRLVTKYAATVFGAEREGVEVAYPGDIVALINAGGVRPGDSLFADGSPVAFPPLPAFAPEIFGKVRPADMAKTKQFRKGLEQLNEEGVVQVFRDPARQDPEPVIAAVGMLQFDVFKYRMENEFLAPAIISSAPFSLARQTDDQGLKALAGQRGVRVMLRSDGIPFALFETPYVHRRIQDDFPKVILRYVVSV